MISSLQFNADLLKVNIQTLPGRIFEEKKMQFNRNNGNYEGKYLFSAGKKSTDRKLWSTTLGVAFNF